MIIYRVKIFSVFGKWPAPAISPKIIQGQSLCVNSDVRVLIHKADVKVLKVIDFIRIIKYTKLLLKLAFDYRIPGKEVATLKSNYYTKL